MERYGAEVDGRLSIIVGVYDVRVIGVTAVRTIRHDVDDRATVVIRTVGTEWIGVNGRVGEGNASVTRAMGVQHSRTAGVQTVDEMNVVSAVVRTTVRADTGHGVRVVASL